MGRKPPWAPGSEVAVAAEGTLLWPEPMALGLPHSLLKVPVFCEHKTQACTHLDFKLEWVLVCVAAAALFPSRSAPLVHKCPQKRGAQWCLLMQTQP